MPLQDILATIKKDAEMEAQKIKEGAKIEIDNLKKQLDSEIEKSQKKLLSVYKLKLAKKVKSIKFQQESASRTQTLLKKQELIDSIFNRATDNLTADAGSYAILIKKQIKNLPKVGDGEIIIAEGNNKKTKAILKELNLDYPVAERTVKGAGGFVLESPTLSINNTVETLVKRSREEIQMEIAKILFNE